MSREEDNWENINPDGRIESIHTAMLDGEWVHVLSPQQYFNVKKTGKYLNIVIVILGILIMGVLA